MKIKMKAIITLTLVVCLLLTSGVSAFAATYTYSTQYTVDNGKVATRVVAKAASVTGEVTYYATNGDGDIVYIDQKTASDNSANFEYIADSSDVVISNMKFGGTNESASQVVGSEDSEGYYTVNVYNDADQSEKPQPITTGKVEANDNSNFEGKYLARTISLSSVTDVGKVYWVEEGKDKSSKIDITDECVFINGVLTVYSNKVASNGSLYIVDTGSSYATVFLGDHIYDSASKSHTVLFKVNGDVDEYGIVLSSGEITDTTSDKFVEADITDMSKLVKFQASGKATDGSAAIALVDDSDTHFATGKYVKAYYKKGNTYYVSAKTYTLAE